MLNVAAILVVLAALFAVLNHLYLKLPMTIGVMAVALGLSLSLVAASQTGLSPLAELKALEVAFVRSIDFHHIVMEGMLSLLLFAGALHIDLTELRRSRRPVLLLAVGSTLVSTVLVGLATVQGLAWVEIDLPLTYGLLFGALISATDPIAVLGILKSAKVPKSLETLIAGESLFNDGVAVVLFTLLVAVVEQGRTPTLPAAVSLFAREAIGGVAYGGGLGYIAYQLLRRIDDYQIEVLITLATVMGGYALAHALHVSGPLAVVVVGLVIGTYGRALAMSKRTREHVDLFWELLDTILNAVLFVLIGLEIVIIVVHGQVLIGAAVVIAVTLLARTLTVGLPVRVWYRWFGLPKGAAVVLTWAGVRGGISVALALSLPPGPERETIEMLTYSVVVFSTFVQGLTIGRLARRLESGESVRTR